VATVTDLSRGVAAVGGLAVAGAVLPAGTETALLALAGTVTLLFATTRQSETEATIGGALLLGAIVVAGWQGLAGQSLVLGTVCAMLAWDSAVTAVGLGRQIENGETRRVEVVHAGIVLVVTAGVGGVVTAAFVVGQGIVPASAVLPVLAGAVLVAAGLGPRLAD
jgi:hypothetical protein